MSDDKTDLIKSRLWQQTSGPLLTLSAMALIELLSRVAFTIPNPPALLLLLVVLSAFNGGTLSGLISAALAWMYFAYFFSIPGALFQYADEDLQRVLVWAFTTPAMAVMVGYLRHRAERVFRLEEINAMLEAQSAALEHQATHDSLTDLPNRYLLYADMERAFGNARRRGKLLALLLMDLDRFKEINDTLGHQSGDRLLRLIGPRLQGRLSGRDTVARLGGDEFAIVLGDLDTPQDAIRVVRRLLDGVKQPFDLSGIKLQVDASVGIALSPTPGRDASTLMRCADIAMYQAKKGAEGYAVYDPDIDQHSPQRLALLAEVGQAIRENQLVLHYQPKINIKERRTVGMEALVRWQHPQHGLIPPSQFIPLVEVSDLIKDLTLWVIDHALEQYRCWREAGLEVPKIAVNISARNLLDGDLPGRIEALLQTHRAPPGCLDVEITESAIISDPARALEVLTRLNAIGVTLSIDDFGTGYSSLSYLRRLPVQSLKIDISFVSHMLENEEDAVIVHSTIGLAHNLGLNVIAEGVEDQDTLNMLEILDCNEAQGYFVSRPIDTGEMTKWLKEPRWAGPPRGGN
ncbi:MAG: EAL domain-containing protein [Gammaproteobacteria bacterium]|nr:EAL domain-containing protein [Gammaproteobacteria bacterium]